MVWMKVEIGTHAVEVPKEEKVFLLLVRAISSPVAVWLGEATKKHWMLEYMSNAASGFIKLILSYGNHIGTEKLSWYEITSLLPYDLTGPMNPRY